MPVNFGVDMNELSFSASSTTRSVTVSSGKRWDVTSKPEWISLQSISPGQTSYEWTVNFTASANDGYNREGIIDVKAGSDAAKISVTQEGRKGKYIAVESVSLIPTELTLTEGEYTTLSYTISPSNASVKDVTWTTSASDVATVSNNGRIDAVAEGTALITVTTSDGNKTASCAVTVIPKVIPVTGVSLDRTSLTLTEGDVQELIATVAPSNATDKSVTWSSSNTSVATVSSSGVVSAKAAGTATITVTTNNGRKKATCSVTVSAVTVSVTGVSLNKASLSMTVGDTQTLIATVTPSNATDKSVTWSSSNTSIATVSSSGVVAAKAAGSATITVTTADGGKTAICSVTVNAQTISVTSVSLDCGSLSLDVGLTHTLVPTVSPSNATDKSVSWTSSNTTVATVSSSGMVTARAAGSATITVTTNDGGKMATCSVSVLDPVELGALSIKSISFSRAVVSCPISYGHNMVLEKGVCVSTKPSLTPFDNEGIFLAATDEEMLSLVIDGLSQGTTYYVIAFVTTSSDYGRTGSSTTVYTKPVSFTTLTAPNYVVPGLFSASSTKKVYLASGNLMYKESDEQYHIFDHQYKGKTMLTREQILADHYCAEHKMSLEARMDEIGVPHHQYYRWKKKYRQEDASGTGPA